MPRLFRRLRQRVLFQHSCKKCLISREGLGHLPDLLRPEFFFGCLARFVAQLTKPLHRRCWWNREAVPSHEIQDVADDVLSTILGSSDDDTAGLVLKSRLPSL